MKGLIQISPGLGEPSDSVWPIHCSGKKAGSEWEFLGPSVFSGTIHLSMPGLFSLNTGERSVFPLGLLVIGIKWNSYEMLWKIQRIRERESILIMAINYYFWLLSDFRYTGLNYFSSFVLEILSSPRPFFLFIPYSFWSLFFTPVPCHNHHF